MIKQILTHVTVTGADDSVKPDGLVKIQEEYPYAEFGILLSQKYSEGGGAVRFPSRRWLRRLAAVNKEPFLNLSGHLCGQWVRDALLGQWPNLNSIVQWMDANFQRFQINTHAQPHEVNVPKVRKILKELDGDCHTAIFQIDGNVGASLAAAMANGKHENIEGLFDLSHGAGLCIGHYCAPLPGLRCGYAGGLSPENVVDELEKIQEVATDTWIDAETRLRSQNDTVFDLGKVRAFLEAAKPWVKQ